MHLLVWATACPARSCLKKMGTECAGAGKLQTAASTKSGHNLLEMHKLKAVQLPGKQ